MKGVIVCGGNISEPGKVAGYFEGADLIICADSGAAHMERFGMIPDILLGDFDSIPLSTFDSIKEKGVEILKYPAEKDMTDSELAVRIALERGCDQLVILGGTGSRIDHSLSNILLLKTILDAGADGLLADEHNEVRLTDKAVTLEKEEGARVSIIPLSAKAFGITTKGLYYELNNAVMDIGSSWGISNEFSEKKALVTVKEGLLLVIKARD